MEHYFTNKDSNFNVFRISDNILGESYQFFVTNGVFSNRKVDDGTKTLIESLKSNQEIDLEKKDVLDLGCGYGPVAVYLKKNYNLSSLSLADINWKAVFLAKRNFKLNKIDAMNVNFYTSDAFEKIPKSLIFDYIILNPPYSAGNEVCFRLFKESREFLKEKGILFVVVKNNQFKEMFVKEMSEIFSNVKEIYENRDYKVFISKK